MKRKGKLVCALILAAVTALPGMSVSAQDLGLNTEQKEATEYTKAANDEVYALLDFEDERERENAERGLITAPDSLEITTEDGKVAWSQDAYAFLDESVEKYTAQPRLRIVRGDGRNLSGQGL